MEGMSRITLWYYQIRYSCLLQGCWCVKKLQKIIAAENRGEISEPPYNFNFIVP